MRMSQGARRRPSPAMIVAALALTFALAGTAIAADPVAKLNAKKVRKIARQEIDKKAPNLSVKKADTATQAVNSFLANGQAVHKLFTKIPTGTTSPAIVLNAGGLTLTATCDAGGNIDLIAATSVNNSVIGSDVFGAAAGGGFDNDFDSGAADVFDPLDGAGQAQGTLTYSTPTGEYVTANFAADEANTFADYNGCVVVGSAISG